MGDVCLGAERAREDRGWRGSGGGRGEGRRKVCGAPNGTRRGRN